MLVAGLLALFLSACASDRPPQGHHHDREAGRGRPPSASLFVSPSGQPFRSAAGQPYPVAKWFVQANKAGDGRLTRAEFRADAEAFFHQLDENHDGVIDPFELSDYEQRVAPEIMGAYGGGEAVGRRRGPADGGGANSVAVLQGAAVYGLLNEPEPVAAADLSLDGRITLDEFMTMTDRRFDQLDAKHLGYLTLADLPKTPAQMMMEGGKEGKDGHGERPSSDHSGDR